MSLVKTRKRQRLYVLLLVLAGVGGATGLALSAFRDSVVFFYAPSEIAPKGLAVGQHFRLGGLVELGSVRHVDGGPTTAFTVTDTKRSIIVQYTGILPDLFREGQGVVANGALNAQGVFVAAEVLAKHDENYMPPEVHDALKRAGATDIGS
jgi:cytochrome c-type biogenesis protein CcmE